MLLMGYRSEIESCNSYKSEMLLGRASTSSKGRSSTSSSTDGLRPARSRSVVMLPLSALAQVENSEASMSGRGEESCQGAAHLMTGFCPETSATFAGVFHADEAGSAHAFLQDLAAAAKQAASTQQPHSLLATAVEGLPLPRGCTGCAAVVCNESISFVSVGDGLIALCNEAGKRSQTELLAGPEVASTPRSQERSMSLQGMAKQKRAAFGSIIPVERAAVSPSASKPVFGCCQLTPSHQFLLLGSGPLEAAMTADQAIDYISRSRQQPANAAKSASLLAAECNRILTQKQEERTHVAVGVVHLQHPDMTRSFSQQLASQEGDSLPGSPPRGDRKLAAVQTSPSGRRVHYLPPFQAKGDEVVVEPPPRSAFGETSTRSPLSPLRPPFGSSSREVPRRVGAGYSMPDSSTLLSSGSLLSRPDMSIPEDSRLEKDSTAMQLPPPLLPPVRKAYPSGDSLANVQPYPSSDSIHITPEMLSSPSPARKAKIGRAASFNSPDGLWPLPPQKGIKHPEQPLVRQTSASLFGARSRGGDEGRVRGGLPRISSTLSITSSTPLTASPVDSPRSRDGASFDEILRNDGRHLPQKAGNDARMGDPWSSNSTLRGRKSHGDTTALRMLHASQSLGNVAAKSAPANLSASLADSLAQFPPLERSTTMSSGTESMMQSTTSGSITSVGRCSVRRVPVIEDSPSGLELLSQSSTASVTNPPPRPASRIDNLAQDFGAVNISSQVHRSSNDLASQRWPLSCGSGQPILSKSSQERSISWPEIDSAAQGQGLLSSLRIEGRQHSGIVFQSGSLNDSLLGSFGDSAGSLTNA